MMRMRSTRRARCTLPARHLGAALALLAACGGDHGPQLATITAGDPTGAGDEAPDASSGALTTAGDPSASTGESTADASATTAVGADTSSTDVTTGPSATDTGATTTPLPPATCGDGALDDGEECGDGDADDSPDAPTVPSPPAADEGIPSGAEGAVDGGGSGDGCDDGGACVDDDDCASGACELGVCAAVACATWTRQWGTASSDFGRGIAVDGEDGVVVSGSVGPDGSVKKFDVDGDELWSDVLDSGEIDLLSRVAIDSAGNAVVTGLTKASLEGQVWIGHDDAVLIKYAPGGEKLWVRQFGTIPDDRAMGVDFDAADNIVVVGSTYGGLDGNVAAGSEDLYVAKFDPQGAKMWTRQLGTGKYDSAWDVAVGPDGGIAVVGASDGAFDGHTSAGFQDAIVIKFSANGTKQWSHMFGTDSWDIASAVAIDKDNAVIVVSNVAGSVDGNEFFGQTDVLVSKFAADGGKLWSRQIGGPLTEGSRGVLVDAAGDIFVGGQTESTFDGNTSAGGRDIFITRFNAAGTKQWTQQFGSALTDDGGVMAMTSKGALVVVGNTLGQLEGPQQGGGDIIAVVRCAP